MLGLGVVTAGQSDTKRQCLNLSQRANFINGKDNT